MSNPRRRRSGKQSDTQWLFLAVAGWFVFRSLNTLGAVSTGGQSIIPQPSGTTWISDPYNGGDGSYFVGALPPGSAPPWRIASEVEAATLQGNLLSQSYVDAGGGLYAPNPGFFS